LAAVTVTTGGGLHGTIAGEDFVVLVFPVVDADAAFARWVVRRHGFWFVVLSGELGTAKNKRSYGH